MVYCLRKYGVGCLIAVLLVSKLLGIDLSTDQGRVLHVREMEEGLQLFKEKVRSILETNCLECHGGEEIEGDFNLSTRESMMESGLVASTADESDLIDSITHRFEPLMPHERDKLNEEDIQAIAQWIDLGAPFDRPLTDSVVSKPEGPMIITDKDRNYWAYKPLSETSVPSHPNDHWSQTEIDRFIWQKLQENELTPNPRANGRTLIRRAYLNTIGLPPTPEEVAEFVNDLQSGAYERMIDRLLDSPHYGERWARHWMDVARFAESTGFEIDFDRPHAYHYRDFLIKAFNRNMPYDQFVRWQIAGDELAPKDPLALMATGFLGGGVFSSVLTENEFESSRYDELDDMVNTIGTAMLGTTIGCARCHDHKYDPIPTKDYYQLAANFTRTVRSYVDHDPDKEAYREALSSWTVENAILENRLHDYERKNLEEPFQNWLQKGSFDIPLERWLVLEPDSFTSIQKSAPEKQWDQSLLFTGNNPEQENETLLVESVTRLQDIRGLRMEALTHPTLPENGPGRDHEGGFTIGAITVHIQTLDADPNRWTQVELESAEATSQENDESWSAGAAINGVSQGWSIDLDAFGQDQAIVIRFLKPVGFEGGTRIKIRVSSRYNIQQMVGRPRFSITLDPKAPVEVSKGIPVSAYEGLLKLLVGMKPDDLRPPEKVALKSWYGQKDPTGSPLWKEWAEHQWDRPIPTKIRIMVSNDSLPPIWHRSAVKGFPSFYESTHFLPRGDVSQKEEAMHPGVLQVLNPMGVQSSPLVSPRKSLVDWLSDVDNGAGSLLARVFVNRVWYYHFGQGIVATPSDFGKQGGDPSHPELLEWLANDFVQHGWDTKRLQRQILTSSIYQQHSAPHPTKAEIDPDNRLLWQFSSRRVEAEVIRDSMLHVSGLLDPTLFGPGTRDPSMVRRSVYFFLKRAALIPEMLLFDWPEHLVGISQRASTTIAPQALQFLNGSETRRYAEAFASRLEDLPDKQNKIKQAYQLVLGRFPSPMEMELGIQFLEAQEASYAPSDVDPQSAWVDYCQSLFSLNEFLYIR